MVQKKFDLAGYKKLMGIKNKKSVAPKVKGKKAKTSKKKKTAISLPGDGLFHRIKKVFVDSEELPADYNKTGLTLIARDPYWIHAYWEITSDSVDEIRKKIGDKFEQASYVLRMYDVTLKDFNGDNANNWFDIVFTPEDKSWYVSLWKDCVTYCGAIGIRTADQEFFVLAKSNFVTTPRENCSGRNDMIWMDVPPGDQGEGQPYPFVFIEQLKKRKTKYPHQGKGRRRRIHLTADDIRAYYYNLFPLLKILKSKRFSGGKPVLQSLTQENLEQSSPYGSKEGPFYKKIKLGASQELILQGGASEREEKKRKFFFELGTELIVYGRTEPDAEVFWGDQKVELCKDGTFSVRLALGDDTAIPLHFTAVSGDKKEQRTIATSANRTKTMYSP